MRLLGLFIVGVVLCAAQTAAAAVLIMPSDTTRDSLLAWGQARPVIEPRSAPYTAGPVALGDGVVYSTTSANSVLGYTGTYSFAGNGSWQSHTLPMAGANEAQGSMSFAFATPISAIVAQTNWATIAGGQKVTVSIYNDADVLLETLVVSDGKVDFQKGGSYLGFIRPTADIAKITFSNGFIGARDFFSRYISNEFDDDGDWDGRGGGWIGDRDGHFSNGPPTDQPAGPGGGGLDLPGHAGAVPEPSTWALMLMGFGGMGAMLRSTRRRQAALA